jgi:hypothetical protein
MKGNTMKKTMILTTALVSMLAVSANAELKIKGGIETTYGTKETASTTSEGSVGNAIGQETKFEFNHTKDLVGGWTSKLDMEVMEVAGTVADTEITISNGDTSFMVSKDGGSIHDNNIVPGAYNSAPADNLGNASGNLSLGTIHGVQNFGVRQKIDGIGKVEFRYAPDTQASNTAGDKATGRSGGSGTEFGFSGGFGVDGLSIALSRAVQEQGAQNSTKTKDAESTLMGIAYNFGQFAVGYQQNDFEDPEGADNNTSSSTNDQKHTLYGVTFAASDALTLGVSFDTVDENTVASDEETTQFEVAYNLGGATVALSYQQTENDGGTAGKDADAYSITYKQSF